MATEARSLLFQQQQEWEQEEEQQQRQEDQQVNQFEFCTLFGLLGSWLAHSFTRVNSGRI